MLQLLGDQENLILDKGYETLTRKDVGYLAACTLGMITSLISSKQDYLKQLEDDYYQLRDDYIQELKDQKTNN
jgi:hypothetical protein